MKMYIEKMGINGEGIAYLNRKPIFVEGAYPTETVEVEILKEEARYATGKMVKLVKGSVMRVEPKCRLISKCKVCTLMGLTLVEQAKQKRELLCQALQKYARIPTHLVEEVVSNPQPYGYRNQCKMPIQKDSGVIQTGMYLPNTNHFVHLALCVVHEPALEEKRQAIMDIISKYDYSPYNKKERKGLRTLVLRHLDGGFQCTIVTGKDNLSAPMVDEIFALEGMKCVAHSVNMNIGPDVFGKELRVLRGEIMLPVKVNDLTLHVSCRSFFQLNTVQTANLYRLVHDLLAGESYRCIIEAYSGVGGLALSVKDLANEIIGIESISSAVKNANENAARNDASHVKFILGDAGMELRRIAKAKKNMDVVIVDPPRTGLSEEFLETILHVRPKKMVYVSCNPSTLGKDLSYLLELYETKRIIPIDMFSHTSHVETVVLLVRKEH